MNADLDRDGMNVGLDRRQYYASSQGPFHNPGNILLFFGGGERAGIVDAIVASIGRGEPIAHVHGERGSGKTLLGLVLADRLAERRNVIRFDHDALGVTALLRQLSIELCPERTTPAGARPDPDMRATPAARARDDEALAAVLSQLAAGTPGDRPILLIIDSQAPVDAGVLQLLERLTRVRRDGVRSLQVLLFERIAPQVSRALGTQQLVERERAAHHHWLRRLTLAEIGDYLRHHMMLVDFSRRDVFSREMAYFIADRSEGVFRSIDSIARNAFVVASLENAERPTMTHLLIAGLPPREDAEPRPRFLHRHRRVLFAALASSVLASLVTAVLLAVH